jgi:flagellar biosynthetic protein FliO
VAEGAFAFGELLKLIVALGVTIGLFYALALFMKRMQVGTGRGGSMITVLAALPLGGKEKLWVVEVAGEKLVVGTSPGRVSCLHVLQRDAAAHSSFPISAASSPSTTSSFPRRRESSDAQSDSNEATLDSRLRGNDEGVETALDSRLRGNDDEVAVAGNASPGNASPASTASQNVFAALLQNFRGGEKS